MRNTTPNRIVAPMYARYFLKFFMTREAQAITIVILEEMSTAVFSVASGISSAPRGHSGEPTRSKIYVVNKAPNSITSDARKSQMPIFALKSPVSGRGEIVYGISIVLYLYEFVLRSKIFWLTRY